MTHLAKPFPLFSDEFVCRTVTNAANMDVKTNNSGDLFDAKRLYEEFAKCIHWLGLIRGYMHETFPTTRVILDSKIPLRSKTRTFANAEETHPIFSVLFNDMRISTIDIVFQKRVDTAISARVRCIRMWH